LSLKRITVVIVVSNQGNQGKDIDSKQRNFIK
jgi:hypothetical protein